MRNLLIPVMAAAATLALLELGAWTADGAERPVRSDFHHMAPGIHWLTHEYRAGDICPRVTHPYDEREDDARFMGAQRYDCPRPHRRRRSRLSLVACYARLRGEARTAVQQPLPGMAALLHADVDRDARILANLSDGAVLWEEGRNAQYQRSLHPDAQHRQRERRASERYLPAHGRSLSASGSTRAGR